MEIKKIKPTLLKLDNKNKIKFIVLFGSVAQGTSNQLSDIDAAVFYQGNAEERFKFRVQAAGELPDKVDVQIFQDLPLMVKKEVLAGKPLYYTDFQFIFDEFMKVIKEYNTFEKYYKEYLSSLREEVKA